MSKKILNQISTMMLCIALLSALTACGVNRREKDDQIGYEVASSENAQSVFEDGYAAGYADGFEDGQNSASTAPEPTGSNDR